jgi:hypothetical protein
MTCCDAIAAAGVSGLMDPVQAGLACGSDTAHLSMFGYDPRQYYRGRGAFETMGAGLDMQPGDIAFKVAPSAPCNHLCRFAPAHEHATCLKCDLAAFVLRMYCTRTYYRRAMCCGGKGKLFALLSV